MEFHLGDRERGVQEIGGYSLRHFRDSDGQNGGC